MITQPTVILNHQYADAVIPLIEKADNFIDIIIYDWRIYLSTSEDPVARFTNAIHNAVLRGVTVRALVNNVGVRDYLNSLHIKAKILNSTKILHAKTILIDNRYMVCGSHNFTKGGMQLNHEISVAVDLGTIENPLRKYFNDLYGI